MVPDDAQRLADAQNAKYAGYGMKATAETYLHGGVFALRAERILAWTDLTENATRLCSAGAARARRARNWIAVELLGRTMLDKLRERARRAR
jgi:hypothetical protein